MNQELIDELVEKLASNPNHDLVQMAETFYPEELAAAKQQLNKGLDRLLTDLFAEGGTLVILHGPGCQCFDHEDVIDVDELPRPTMSSMDPVVDEGFWSDEDGPFDGFVMLDDQESVAQMVHQDRLVIVRASDVLQLEPMPQAKDFSKAAGDEDDLDWGDLDDVIVVVVEEPPDWELHTEHGRRQAINELAIPSSWPPPEERDHDDGIDTYN